MELQTNVRSGEVKITEGTPEAKPVEVTTEKKPEADLITRVSQFKKEETAPEETKLTSETRDTFGLTQEDFGKVQNDPVLSKFYKSMQADYTRKTQAAANDKKEAERIKTEYSTWTPERVQQLLNDQTFVNAAQSVMKTQAPTTFEGTQEEWSGLSDTDKAKFQQLTNKVNLLEQQNYQVRKIQEDETLKTKYNNYDPQAIDILTADLLKGKVQATREHLFKVYDYENAVERAYHLGIQDGKTGIREKVSSSSMEGTMATTNREQPKPEQGENDRAFFKRVFLDNVAKHKETSIKK